MHRKKLCTCLLVNFSNLTGTVYAVLIQKCTERADYSSFKSFWSNFVGEPYTNKHVHENLLVFLAGVLVSNIVTRFLSLPFNSERDPLKPIFDDIQDQKYYGAGKRFYQTRAEIHFRYLIAFWNKNRQEKLEYGTHHFHSWFDFVVCSRPTDQNRYPCKGIISTYWMKLRQSGSTSQKKMKVKSHIEIFLSTILHFLPYTTLSEKRLKQKNLTRLNEFWFKIPVRVIFQKHPKRPGYRVGAI